MNDKELSRLDYIDVAKAIGMFAIIWGHIQLVGWSNLLVYSFHIPLFFFLSGMMFNAEKYPTVCSLIKKRIKTLLLPYLIFSVLTWILWVGMNVVQHNSVDIWMPLLETVIAQGSGGFMVHNVPLWFVTCLFVVELLYYFINKLPEWANVLCCLLCALIGHYMINGGHLDVFRLLPWNIEGAMSAILFYSLGNLLIRHTSHKGIQDVVLNNKFLSCAIIVVLTTILFFVSTKNGHITLGSNSLGNNTIMFYINAFIGIITTMTFGVLLASWKGRRTIGKAVSKYIRWVGINSFYFMATHVPVKGIMMIVVATIFGISTETVSHEIQYAFAAFVPTILIDSIVVWIVCYIKEKDIQRKQRKTIVNSLEV